MTRSLGRLEIDNWNVVTHAFVDAMRSRMILPISLLIVAALAALFVRADKPTSAVDEEQVAVA